MKENQWRLLHLKMIDGQEKGNGFEELKLTSRFEFPMLDRLTNATDFEIQILISLVFADCALGMMATTYGEIQREFALTGGLIRATDLNDYMQEYSGSECEIIRAAQFFKKWVSVYSCRNGSETFFRLDRWQMFRDGILESDNEVHCKLLRNLILN